MDTTRRKFTIGGLISVGASLLPNYLYAGIQEQGSVSERSVSAEELAELWERASAPAFHSDGELEAKLQNVDDFAFDLVKAIKFVRTKNIFSLAQYDGERKAMLIRFEQFSKRDLAFLRSFMFYFEGEINPHNELVKAIDINNPDTHIPWEKFPEQLRVKIYDDLQKELQRVEAWRKEPVQVHHELTHAIFDKDIGTYRSEIFSGPSEKELKEHVIAILATDARKELIKVYDTYSIGLIPHLENKYGSLESFLRHDFSAENKRLQKYQEIKRRYSSFINDGRNVPTLIWGEALRFKPIEPGYFSRRADLLPHDKALLQPLEGISLEEIKKLLQPITFTIEGEKKTTSYYFGSMPHIRFTIDEFKHGRMAYTMTFDRVVQSMVELGIPQQEIWGFITHQIEMNVQKTIVGETVAREMESLYQVYRGPQSETLFTIQPALRRFWESWEYDGKAMFRKMLEKNLVADFLIADGQTPEQVQQKLEYATTFEHKGIKYDWPRNSISLKGKIAYDDNEHMLPFRMK